MKQISAVKGFEEVYKTAYSHGLEDIYALENVDIKTVRPLGGQKSSLVPEEKKEIPNPSLAVPPDRFFSFGLSYAGKIEPFVLKEPVHVLGLTRYIENTLLSLGKKTLRDLLDLAEVPGFGQGHITDIKNKLYDYLDGRHLMDGSSIDFAAWLKATVAGVDKKRAAIALAPYGLDCLCPLSMGESLEVRRLTLEKRCEWREEAMRALCCDERRHQVDKDLCQIVEVFIKPWMDGRQGIATEAELHERLQRLSHETCCIQPYVDFFQESYFNGGFLLNHYLEPLDVELFAAERWVAEEYDQLIALAETYFYNSQAVYRFDALVSYLESEFARSWKGFREGFVSKILKMSPRFFVHKNPAGVLLVRLA